MLCNLEYLFTILVCFSIMQWCLNKTILRIFSSRTNRANYILIEYIGIRSMNIHCLTIISKLFVYCFKGILSQQTCRKWPSMMKLMWRATHTNKILGHITILSKYCWWWRGYLMRTKWYFFFKGFSRASKQVLHNIICNLECVSHV